MNKADLLALAARVEAAQGADRALDAEIVQRTTPGIVGIERGPLDYPNGPEWLFLWEPRRSWADSWHVVPAFTASIDAAASLVPEDWWLDCLREERTKILYRGDKHEPTGKFYAALQHILGGRLTYTKAATPALALTAAALRAMAEKSSP